MKWFFGLLFILSLSLVFIASGPFRTIWGIHRAIEADNYEELQVHIDFISVKESLKVQIDKRVQEEILLRTDDPLMSLFLSKVAPEVSGSLFDEYLTVDGVSKAITYAKQKTLPAPEKKKFRPFNKVAGNLDIIFATIEFRYVSWRNFEIEVKDNTSEFSGAKIIFTRRGINWPLSGIQLPDSFDDFKF